jgi:cation diffusion facilitator family transporter
MAMITLIHHNFGEGITSGAAMQGTTGERIAERTRLVSRVLWITLLLNWLVAGTKITLGIVLSNLTVLADGFHSLLDSANNVLGIVAINMAARPADEDHPYGHRKFEHVAAMIIGGLVMLLCWEVIQTVFERVVAHLKGENATAGMAEFQWWFLAIPIATMVINLFVALYEHREGTRLDSMLLKADAKHTFSDTAVTAAGLVSLLTSGSFWWMDALLASAVAAFLLYAAWSILKENLGTMTDRSRLDPVEVRDVAESVEGVEDAHAIRSHGMENDIHLDLHIVVASTLTAGEVEAIETKVRTALSDRFPQVTLISVHHQVEDENTGQPVWKT